MTRWWNEPKTLDNDQRTLAKHLVAEHGTNSIATPAAPLRMLREVHGELHTRCEVVHPRFGRCIRKVTRGGHGSATSPHKYNRTVFVTGTFEEEPR